MNTDTTEAALSEAAHDAFMLFWRATDTDTAEALWLAYCAAQERFEQWLREHSREESASH